MRVTKISQWCRWFPGHFGCFFSLLLPAPVVVADDIFQHQVAPLLERKCLNCHNHQDRKGQFSLQTREQLADSGFVASGRPDESQLLSVVVAESPDARPSMPKEGTPLTSPEVQLLRDWIESGAKWPDGIELTEPVVSSFDWWSLKPVVRHEPPEFSDDTATHWIKTPVDAFVLAKLREKSLTPSPQADRRTLMRRVTFDLTGLPPTPHDVEAFLREESPDAYDQLVERLLASQSYGERWARHWLDVVRYADTCGYDKDKLRPNAWPYRDYVIRAFNDDKSYARFVQEQLAGDILFPGEPDGILGLGFIAAGPWDFIGHVEVPESKIDGMVARNLDRDDMATGALNTFCSVTIQCARCHNHKFDPFTQEHYYSLQSVFAAVDRAERSFDTDPAVEQRRQELAATRKALQAQQAELEGSIRAEGGAGLTGLDERIGTLRGKAEPAAKRPEYGYHSQIAATADTEKWVEVDLGRDTEIEAVVLYPCHDEFAGIGAGFGFPVRFRIDVVTEMMRADGTGLKAAFDGMSTDFLNPGLAPVSLSVHQTGRFVRVSATRLAERQNDFIFALAELAVITPDGLSCAANAAVTSLDSIESGDRWRQSNLTDGIWPALADPIAATSLAEALKQRSELLRSLETVERIGLRNLLAEKSAATDKELASLPTGRMVYAAATHFETQGSFAATQGKPRTVRVLHRGNETQPLGDVRPGTIPLATGDTWQFELSPEHSEADRRAALALWVTRHDHPLTWRSIVNRVWQYHVGRAIVDSANDFGRMGQMPSHPELLDWLASEFRDNGQSIKSLHRLIVTSAAYRQVSADRPGSARIDADNQFLWRMNRRRLTAEEIRDAILSVSGKLNPEMGGPGFYLFELEKTEHSPHYEYSKFDPEDDRSHRRSVYRFVVRSQPDPFMTTLDCADSSQSTPRRHETLTALQALSLLNNPFNLSMSRHFATRLESESSASEARIDRAFYLLTGRAPTVDENAQLGAYADRHGLPALCRLLFNLSEFVFVD